MTELEKVDNDARLILGEEMMKFVIQTYEGNFRKFTKLPYRIHPLRCAIKAYGFFCFNKQIMDPIEAAYIMACHDIKEDCAGRYSEEELYNLLGHRSYMHVYMLTNPWHTDPQMKQLNRHTRKLIAGDRLATYANTHRGIPFLKLFDIVDNLNDSSPDDAFMYYKYPLECAKTVKRMLSNTMDNVENYPIFTEFCDILKKRNINHEYASF